MFGIKIRLVKVLIVIFFKLIGVGSEKIVNIRWLMMLVLIRIYVVLFNVDKLSRVFNVVFLVLGLIDSICISVLLLVLVIIFLFVLVRIIWFKCWVSFICVFFGFWYSWLRRGFRWFVFVICKVLVFICFRFMSVFLVRLLIFVFLLCVDVILIRVMMVFFFELMCVYMVGFNDNLCRRLIVYFFFLFMLLFKFCIVSFNVLFFIIVFCWYEN